MIDVFVKVNGKLRSYGVDTDDSNEALQTLGAVIKHEALMTKGMVYGACLALVANNTQPKAAL